MYYNKETDTYYENDQSLLRLMIFDNRLYEKGFTQWTVKRTLVEVFPNVTRIKNTFIIYYFYNGKKRKVQMTVFQVDSKPSKREYSTVEKWVAKSLSQDNLLTEYGKAYYQQVLTHFKKYLSIKELQNNLFFFNKTIKNS